MEFLFLLLVPDDILLNHKNKNNTCLIYIKCDGFVNTEIDVILILDGDMCRCSHNFTEELQ